jgi:hypothetical protein
MRTDRRTDMTKLIVGFRNFPRVPNETDLVLGASWCVLLIKFHSGVQMKNEVGGVCSTYERQKRLWWG